MPSISAMVRIVVGLLKKETMKDYGSMTMKELIEDVIEQAKKQGCVTYPLRTEGYHQASNLLYTDRLK